MWRQIGPKLTMTLSLYFMTAVGVACDSDDSGPASAAADAGVDSDAADSDVSDTSSGPDSASGADADPADGGGTDTAPDLDGSIGADGGAGASGDAEICDNAADDDGDGNTDCDDLDCDVEPACAPSSCGALDAPGNGAVDTSGGTLEGATATYSCEHGYTLVGAPTRTCEATGIWSGEAPTCEPGVVVPDFVLIEAATFTMGSPVSELGRFSDETQHEVTLTRDFFMQTTEATQEQWSFLMRNNPSYFDSCGPDCPVENVNWWDVAAYANALSASQGLPECFTLLGCTGTPGVDLDCTGVTVNAPEEDIYGCEGYRLATEAEWEYAARGGTTTATYNGDLDVEAGASAVLEPIAWYFENSGVTTDEGSTRSTHPVGEKAANAYGLYDMLGNASEWCWDWYDEYPGDVTDPSGPVAGTNVVIRGGSWTFPAQMSRAAKRGGVPPGFRDAVGINGVGFRLARTAP